MRNIFVIFCGLILSATALASDLSVVAVGGASSTLTGKTVTVFGGTAGQACSANLHSTCNSCRNTTSCVNTMGSDQAPLCACTRARIYDDLIVSVKVKRPARDRDPIRAFAANGPSASEMNYVDMPKAAQNFVNFTWRDICSHINGTSSCEGLNGSLLVTIYSDRDNSMTYTEGESKTQVLFKVVSPGPDANIFGLPNVEGIGGFTPFAGDKQVTITGLSVNLEFPMLSYGSKAKAVRVFVSEKGMDSTVMNEAAIIVDLPVNPDGGLNKSNITGLANGQIYFFRLAVLDEAGNVVQYFPDMTGLKQTNPECFPPRASLSCPYAAIPQRIN